MVAEAQVRRARLALFTGRLDESASYLASAHTIADENTLATQVKLMALLVDGQLLLTMGDFSQAETHFSDAHNQAEAQQEPLLSAEALLGLARTRLSRRELDAASSSFLEAGRQFQLLESTGGDGAAMLGIAQTLIGQEQWDEAIEHCEGALVRFNQSGDLVGQADTILALGLAHRGKDELDEAASNFEQAVTLYQQQHQALGEADARYERAGISLARGQLDFAMSDLAQAITLVERVMNTLSTPEQRSIFLHQYVELYVQAAVTEVRRNQDSQARVILSSFAGIAGNTTVIEHIRVYEDSVPTRGEELTEEEERTNKELIKRLRELRKGL